MNWKDFFDRLGGLNGTPWQWRIRKWEDRWNAWRENAGFKGKQVVRPTKFCTSCNALLVQDEEVCPYCHAKAPSWGGQVAKRAVGLIMPTAVPIVAMILVANLIMFGLVLMLDGYQALLKPSGPTLVRLGALFSPYLHLGEYWRLVTYGYLHLGIIHIGFNMMVLTQIGPVLEKEIGGSRFFSIYTLSLIGGGVADWVFRTSVFSVVGASGALFGLIGFGLSYCHFEGGRLARMHRDLFIRWALFAFVFGFVIGADNIAHAGGFAVGAAMGFCIQRERSWSDRLTPVWKAIACVFGLLTGAAFVLLFLPKS